MSTITTKDGTEIYYKDWGSGPVVTFSYGWPLNSDAWDGQMHAEDRGQSRRAADRGTRQGDRRGSSGVRRKSTIPVRRMASRPRIKIG
jgi:pimeloyl-ACP methyl ester carboxylesterase